MNLDSLVDLSLSICRIKRVVVYFLGLYVAVVYAKCPTSGELSSVSPILDSILTRMVASTRLYSRV